MSFFTLKVASVGVEVLVVNKLIFFNDAIPDLPHQLSSHLRSILRKEVLSLRVTKKHRIVFGDSKHIRKVTFPGGTCAESLLDAPVSILLQALQSYKKKDITIEICPDTTAQKKNVAPVDLMDKNRIRIVL